MASGGNVNFDDLKKFRDKLEQNFSRAEVDRFIESCAKELAARLLAKVIKGTLPGQYPKGSGKVGGTLRRGWTSKTHEEAVSGHGSGKPAAQYAQTLKVNHFGDAFVIEIVNPVEYAPYVEFGHRTRNHKGWIEGKFVLSISEGEIKRDAPKILEKKLKKKLGECFK